MSDTKKRFDEPTKKIRVTNKGDKPIERLQTMFFPKSPLVIRASKWEYWELRSVRVFETEVLEEEE